jgi:NADH-quinone oxidoreductase subunit H
MIERILTFIPPWLIILLVVMGVVNGTVAYLILLERKIASWVQDRIGPNRAGPMGLLQPIADGIKMFVKEDFRSTTSDKWLFSVAPGLMMLVVTVALAVIPWGGVLQGTRHVVATSPAEAIVKAEDAIPLGSSIYGSLQATGNPNEYVATYRFAFQIADVNIGVLFIVAVLSLAVYGIVFGSWASNSKFAFLGGMRAAAQMISYEVPLGLSIVTIVLTLGTLSLSQITNAQAHYWAGWIPAWNIFCQPLAFLMFLICIHAEANRAPFDLAECEQELVGGYHTEYSSMRFGLFFLAEYTEMLVSSGVLVALFLGGWHFPGLTGDVDPNNPAVTTSIVQAILRCVVYFVKILVVISLFMWVRWTLPRFRYDQLMNLAWRAFVPISLLTMAGSAVVVYLLPNEIVGGNLLRITGQQALALLGVNVLLVVIFAIGATLIPAAPLNRRMSIPGSRWSQKAKLPA